VIEPRNDRRDADTFVHVEGNTAAHRTGEMKISLSVEVQWIAGVREGGTSAKGCPGTWEILLFPVE
jgi:hypothetical protein